MNSCKKNCHTQPNALTLPFLLVVQLFGSTLVLASAPTTHTTHLDHLGGTAVITNASGTAVQTLSYYPFGKTRLNDRTTSFSERNTFTGHELDDTTGLYYMQQRYQNPETGRFVSQDSAFLDLGRPEFKQLYNQPLHAFLANPQELNAYSHVGNNPLNVVDKDGRCGILCPLVPYVPSALAGLSALTSSAFLSSMVADDLATANSTNASVGQKGLAIGSLLTGALPASDLTSFRRMQLITNAANGARREAEMAAELAKQYPGASILRQVYLRDASGNLVRDTKSGMARRIDFAVVQDGKALDRVEVTSLTAKKGPQQIRESNIINSGGTYIRNSDGSLINFANQTGGVTTPARVVRRPRRRRYAKVVKKKGLPKLEPSYILENWKQLMWHYRTNVSPPYTDTEIRQIKYGIFVGYKFLQDSGFTVRALVHSIDDIDELVVKVEDLTQEGLEFHRTSWERYLRAIDDIGKDPVKSCKRILERDLKKMRQSE